MPFLNDSCNFIKLVVIIRMYPFIHKRIAKLTVRLGNIFFQPVQAGRLHSDRKSRQQNVRSQRYKRCVISMGIAGITVHKLPKSIFTAELFYIRYCFVIFNIESAHQHSSNNARSRVVVGSRKDGKDIKMQLTDGVIVALKRHELCDTVFVFKELCIILHRLAKRSGGRHIQLLHTDREQIRTELLAVKLNIEQPIITNIRVRNRVINKIIALRIVIEKQLFCSKVV